MQRKRLILILLGLTLSFGSAYGMYKNVGNLESKISVAVAIKQINANEKLGPENVKIINMPVRYVLQNAISDINMLLDKEATVRIYQGEQIIRDRISEKVIKPSDNERLFFIPVENIVMKPGQSVDIYLVYTPGKSLHEGVERLLADKVIVSIIGDRGQNAYLFTESEKVIKQSGIEVLLTHEEILLYLDRKRFSEEVIVRHGEEN